MTMDAAVAVIDDDEAVRDSLAMMLSNHGFGVCSFASADAFMAVIGANNLPSCVVCDIRMPGMSGLELQRELAKKWPMVPLVLITGHGDVSMAVNALKAGAYDFVEKPFAPDRLIESIKSAIDQNEHKRNQDQEIVRLSARINELSDRQKQVMDLAVKGLSNKEIALSLKISPRTVETYRAWVMEKTGARNIADLVRIAMRLEENGSSIRPRPRSVGVLEDDQSL
ncbi:response regulator transcription factor [Hyphomicrobium sp.]|jgi:two-component system response regulator FixJ|uniref:response regulator transcription factor n=1 Tax=Hyphomicrobium sp. TaxID=82 RepID=UPI002B59D42D|nr:response regulator [Hyphomicrobium sp.]HVZ04773.1 response regulator [Hyphomicrobium sp.]